MRRRPHRRAAGSPRGAAVGLRRGVGRAFGVAAAAGASVGSGLGSGAAVGAAVGSGVAGVGVGAAGARVGRAAATGAIPFCRSRRSRNDTATSTASRARMTGMPLRGRGGGGGAEAVAPEDDAGPVAASSDGRTGATVDATGVAETARRVSSDSRWNFSILMSSRMNSCALAGRRSGDLASRRATTSRVAIGRSAFNSSGSRGSVWRIW